VTGQLGVAEIAGYLRDSGWQRHSVEWRGASIWSFGEDEVLVPGRDGMGDGDLRVREIVGVLATVEQRPREEIAQDIRMPWADSQWFRIFPEGLPSGFTTLRYGIQLLTGVEGALRAAARSVVEGPRLAFRGDAPASVEQLLARVQIGAGIPGSYVLPVRVPLDGPEDGLGRLVTLRLHAAVSVLSGIRETSENDELVSAEISADLCESLGDLGGERGQSPFEIRFRWARKLRAEVPEASYDFQSGAGAVIRGKADELRRLSTSDTVTVTGSILGLRHEDSHDDGWSIEVRGEVVIASVTRRTIWARLPDRTTYESAIAAHRAGRRVRVRGVVSSRGRRMELIAEAAGFEVLD
jgi:hypothetical protein